MARERIHHGWYSSGFLFQRQPNDAIYRHFFWRLRHSVIFSVLAVLRVAEQSAATMTLAFAARRAS